MFDRLKKKLVLFVSAALLAVELLPALATPVYAEQTPAALVSCSSKANAAAKLVTRSSAYESKNAAKGDIVQVTFVNGCTSATSICITSGTKSVAAGVKPLNVNGEIPKGATVTLVYSGTGYDTVETFAALETYTASSNGTQPILIPSGAGGIKISAAATASSRCTASDCSHSITATAQGKVYLLDSSRATIGTISSGDTYVDLVKDYPTAKYVKLEVVKVTKTDSSHKDKNGLNCQNRAPSVTASTNPQCIFYSVTGGIMAPPISSNLSNLRLLEGQDANLLVAAANTDYFQWQKWTGTGSSFRSKYSPTTEDGCTIVNNWGEDSGLTDENEPTDGWTMLNGGENPEGNTNFAYTFTTQAADDDTYYRLVLKNENGITISNPAKINVSPASFKSIRAFLSGADSLPIGDTLHTYGYGVLLIYNNGDGVGDTGKNLNTHFMRYLKGTGVPLDSLNSLAGDLTVRYYDESTDEILIQTGVTKTSVSGDTVILHGADMNLQKDDIIAVYSDSTKISAFENTYIVGIFNDGNKQSGYNTQVSKNTLNVGDFVQFTMNDGSKVTGTITAINKNGDTLISYVVKPDVYSTAPEETAIAEDIVACEFCKYCTLSIDGRDAHAPQINALVKNAEGNVPDPESLRQGVDTASLAITISDDIVNAGLKSGSQWIKYKVNTGEWKSYNGPQNVEITENGYYTITAKDGAGNQISETVVVDAFMKTPQSIQFGSDVEGESFIQPAGTIVSSNSLLSAGSVYIQFAGEDDYNQLSATNNTRYQFVIKFADSEDGPFTESHKFKFGEHTVYAAVFNQSGNLLSDVCALTFEGTDTIIDPVRNSENCATAIIGTNLTMKAATVQGATYQWYCRPVGSDSYEPITDVTVGEVTCNGGTDRVITLYSVNADAAGYSFKCAINGELGDQRTIMMIDPQDSNASNLVINVDGQPKAYDDLWAYNNDLNAYEKASDFKVTMTFTNGTPNKDLAASPNLRLIEDNGLSVAQIRAKLAGESNNGDGSTLTPYTVYVYTDATGKEYYYTADDVDHTASNAEGTEIYGYVKDANGTFLKVKERQMYTYYSFGTADSDLGTRDACGAVTSFNIKDRIKPNGLDLGDNKVKLIYINWKNIANSIVVEKNVPTHLPDLYEVTNLVASTQEWTNQNVIVSAINKFPNMKREDGSHKWNNGEWTNADSYEMNSNGSVVLRWRDKVGLHDQDDVLTMEVNNIDKTAPTLSIIVKDATAVTLKAADHESKIAAIYVDSDKLQGQTRLYTGTGTDEEVTLDYRAVVNGNYTFTVVDVAGNAKTGKKKIAPEAYTVTGLSVSEREWTNQNVLVTVSAKNTNLAPATPHSWNGGEWVASKTYTAESNGNVVLRWQYTKGDDMVEGEPFSVNIANIDKTVPSLELTANGVTMSVQAKDSESGISKICVRGPGLAGLTNLATGNGRSSKLKATYTATKNGTFTFIVYDVAGNMTEKEYSISGVPEDNGNSDPDERVSYVYRDRYLTVPGTTKTIKTTASNTVTKESKKKDTSVKDGVNKDGDDGNKKVFTVNSAMYRNLGGDDGTYVVKGNGNDGEEIETLGVSASADTFRPIKESRSFLDFLKATWPWILLILCIIAGVVIGYVLYYRNNNDHDRRSDGQNKRTNK